MDNALYIGNNNGLTMYNIVTDTNLISIREEIFCDFDQSSDQIFNNYIDDLVIHFLNSDNNKYINAC